MDLGIKGFSALVVGGGGGLGSAIARRLAAEGAKVAVAGRHRGPVDAVADEISTAGGAALGVRLDLGDIDAFDEALSEVTDRHGDPQILVNLTGGPPPTPAAGVDPAMWEKQFRSMVLGVIALTDRVLPAMRARGWGRVITSTSSGPIAPIPNLGISNTLRAALHSWSKTLAAEVGPEGVTVNVVVPGRIATPRVAQLDKAKAEREGTTPEQVAAASAASIPVRRYGTPDEYAAAVAFLASAPASYITGTTLRVDGGLVPSL
ncbi:SDR family oxidoreductase [Mycolicibacterium phlei]|jgi:3-oxoacyl-[acyl-carrier protein] reductase